MTNKEKIEEAKRLYQTANADQKYVLERLFPELQESEDERIRKELLEHCKNQTKPYIQTGNKCPQIQSWIAWLEKQGRQKEYTFKSLPRLLNMIEPTSKAKAYCQKLIDTLVKERYVTDAKIVGECLKTMNGDDVPKAIMDEKQGEQKPTDKAVPKFKVGDWIISKYMHLVMQILNNDNGYKTVEADGTERNDSYDFIERNFKLWTIQDAKDGDILTENKKDVILMFRGIGNTEWDDVIDYHCYYDCYQEDFIVQDDEEYWDNIENNQLEPATKEQRDLLFQKMNEAGYELDAEKKELKKIEDESENYKQQIMSAITDLVTDYIRQKPAWSEEDENFFANICSIIDADRNFTESAKRRCKDWLKSLKQRMEE